MCWIHLFRILGLSGKRLVGTILWVQHVLGRYGDAGGAFAKAGCGNYTMNSAPRILRGGGTALRVVLLRVLLCCVHIVGVRGLVLNVISPDCPLIGRGWWDAHELPLLEASGRGIGLFLPLLWRGLFLPFILFS